MPAAGKSGAVFASGSGSDHLLGVTFGPDGNLYVTGYASNTVLRFNGKTGAPMPSAGNSGAVFVRGNGLGGPVGLRFGPDGNLYVAQVGSFPNFQSAVLRFDGKTGAPLPSSGNTGAVFATGGGLVAAHDLVFGADGNLYVDGDAGTNDVIEYNGTTGTFLRTFVTSGSGGLDNPQGMSFGPDGNLYISSTFTNSVLQYDGKTGAFLSTFVAGTGFANSLNQPEGLVFGPDGNLYVSSDDILKYNGHTGAFLRDFVPNGTGQFFAPLYLTFSSVPEPGSLALCAGIGICGLSLLARRRRSVR